MITSIHNLIYSDDAQATRAFLRDVLGWEYVAEEFGNDWLIFKSGPSEMGVHAFLSLSVRLVRLSAAGSVETLIIRGIT